jgi:sec-independent protein translocase protein TatB
MFDIGWTEMLVIAVVMIVVVGPKDLPRMLRTFGKTTAKLRAMAGDFQRQFNDALKEAELDDVKKSVDSLRSLNPAAEIKKQLNPFEKAAADVRSGLDAAMKPAADSSGEAAEPSDAAAPAEPLKNGASAMPGVSGPEAMPAAAPAFPATSAEPAAAAAVAKGEAAAAKPAVKKPSAKAKPATKAADGATKTSATKKAPATAAAATKPAAAKKPAAPKKSAGSAK